VARYPLNLPADLKKEAEVLAAQQNISLNQFIMWAVAEKVSALRHNLADPDYPGITYQRSPAGIPTPILRGSEVQVREIVAASREEQWSSEKIAAGLGLTLAQVSEALSFYRAHQEEIDSVIALEERKHHHHKHNLITGVVLSRLENGLADLYGTRLKGVYLYGSYARGEQVRGSDMDVVIVLDNVSNYGKEIEYTAHLVSELSLEHDLSISTVFIQQTEWQDGETPFLRRVRQEAIPV
jgi:uncharacterized protein (DUF433 family)/predicted nucleotidyltransferase